MRAANIPLEGSSLFYISSGVLNINHNKLVMWNDIDLYHAVRDFTSDPVSFPADEVRDFIRELVSVRVLRIDFSTENFRSLRRLTISTVGLRTPYLLHSGSPILTDIPIVDAAVAKQVNATDIVSSLFILRSSVLDFPPKYDPYTKGTELNVFITNPDGSEYVGQVWPGYTVRPMIHLWAVLCAELAINFSGLSRLVR